MAPVHQKLVKEDIEEMLDAYIIRPGSSAWYFTVVIPIKKDGKAEFCVNYWASNAKMMADSWPIRMIEEISEELGGEEYLSTFDLFAGFDVLPLLLFYLVRGRLSLTSVLTGFTTHFMAMKMADSDTTTIIGVANAFW